MESFPLNFEPTFLPYCEPLPPLSLRGPFSLPLRGPALSLVIARGLFCSPEAICGPQWFVIAILRSFPCHCEAPKGPKQSLFCAPSFTLATRDCHVRAKCALPRNDNGGATPFWVSSLREPPPPCHCEPFPLGRHCEGLVL